ILLHFKHYSFFLIKLIRTLFPGKMQGHNGESREERLAEFLLVNPTALVYALPEGSALHIQNEMATVLGENPILCFSENME
ncbi:Type 1 glutamine amidotransferase-like domain-containing protein, partial [Stenotrophomonas maltophilia]|uniref:Type 1 glutamine amidotransferase-like domain-containing protein n=1 Tax=Stenotrophomonas maltophilia TaxID=40324 RepID=UPI0019542F8D